MLLGASLATAGCDRRPDSGPVVVSAIGGPIGYVDPSRQRLSIPSALLIDSTAQGLVRFDATGQIEPGLAERWTVIDDGMSYIFRLRDATWSDGSPVEAEQVVRILSRQIARDSRNPLAPFLTAIDEIVVMTPQVIEVRLSRPRPDLLKLFAAPELAILRQPRPGGTGPFRIAERGDAPLLRPAVDPAMADPDDATAARPEANVRLIGERAALAVARFANGRADLISGGRFDDWPLVGVAQVAATDIRIDPAAGLFGLAFADRTGFLADAANRTAISEAIDRTALTAAIATGWDPVDHILPDGLDSAAPPRFPAWSVLALADRRAAARAQVVRWGRPVSLTIALPDGPGATLLWGQIAASLASIGIGAMRTGSHGPADLRLIDAVAPYDSARWYLATACLNCGDAARSALEAARLAPTLAGRAQAIAQADAAIDADVAFVPLARPYRWSLVAPRLRQWQPNMRAWHPLNRLRDDPN